MREARMAGLAVVAALVAMVWVGPSSASAEVDTALCSSDEWGLLYCAEENLTNHVHLVDFAATLLTNSAIPSVACMVLFLGEVLGLAQAPAPQVIHGNFRFVNCNAGCTVAEVAGAGTLGGLILVLKVGEDVAQVRGDDFEARVTCAGVIQCSYTGENLVGEGLSAELPDHAGTVHVNDQPISRLSAGPLDICPSSGSLDALLESTTDLYIKS